MISDVVVPSDCARSKSSARSSGSRRTDSTVAGAEPSVGRPRLPRRPINVAIPRGGVNPRQVPGASLVIESATGRARRDRVRRRRDRLHVSLRREVFVLSAGSRSIDRHETVSTAAPSPASMADMSGLDELLTTDEVAELLHIPRSTVSEYARRDVLPSIKLGRHRRFVRSDVPRRSS